MAISALAKKLQLKPATKIVLVNAPNAVAERLRPLPERAAIARTSAGDAAIGFAKDRAELAGSRRVSSPRSSLTGSFGSAFRKGAQRPAPT